MLRVNVKGHQEMHRGHCEHCNFKTILYYIYIFEPKVIGKHGRKDIGDIGKALKKLFLRH
jgi:hypothetical protein